MTAQLDTLTADQRLIYTAMRESVSRVGLTTDAIRRKLRFAKPDYWRIRTALDALCDLGLMEWTKGDGHSRLYSVAGACRLPGEGQNDQRVDLHETDAMAAELEKLFAITPYRYSDGDIVTLERGRVGLKPSLPLPGRAIGGW